MKGFLYTCVLFGALLLQTSAQDAKNPIYRSRTRPEVKSTNKQLADYEKNPANKPKIDFVPKTDGEPQPDTAGVAGGKVSTQIIGGTRATQTQIPWQVLLSIDNTWVCGGSIISSLWVVTAAHCLFNSTSTVIYAGGIDYYNKAESNEVAVTSTVYTVHEQYDDNNLFNDIAVIKSPSALPMNSYINAIRLPKQSQASTTFAGLTMQASGYGQNKNTGPVSSYLYYVALKTITNTLCARTYGTKYIISSIICTAASSTKTICSGDSGGPLAYKESDGKWTLIGIVSFGHIRSCTNYPAGYSRVTSFLGWIGQKTSIAITP
ncbi:trypsin alpha-4-like [Neocloeon triangulifer]|uniref:trypsin alpha-4-like n=1 Tax=Neocloeon triangulifer TaxID=2078957 RepID=UPI00286F8760|nr:trypsin alpha-4-like [Neocloeon triangulifer]